MNTHTNKTEIAQAAAALAKSVEGTANATTVTPTPKAIGELAEAAAKAAQTTDANSTTAAAEALRAEAAKAMHTAEQSINSAVKAVEKKGRFRTFIGNNKILSSVVGVAIVGGIAYGVSLYLKKHVEIEVNL